MNFASPLALTWAVLAIPIVVFYLLRVRQRRVPVSTSMFWSQVFEERRPRALWGTPRHVASLLVQLLLLMLLVLALAGPYWPAEDVQTRRIVLIVDNSASMNATDVVPSRLEVALRHGQRRISNLRDGDAMAILTAGGTPHVACGLTGHPRALREALETVMPSDQPTHVDEAVKLARRVLAGHPRGEIVVLSDGCFQGRGQLATQADVELVALGSNVDNVGITQFQTRRSLIDPVGFQVLLAVQNFSDDPVECRLEILRNEQLIDVLPLKLSAGESVQRAMDHVASEGGRLIARLDHKDALAADNQAVAILPPRLFQEVLLVTEGSLYLERVLEAIPTVRLQVTRVAPEIVPRGVVVVFHRHAPQKLPAGNIFVIDPRQSSDAWTVGEELAQPLVGKHSSSLPLMAHVRMDNAWLPSARKLVFTRPAEVLIETVAGEPIYAAQESTDGGAPAKVLVLAVDLEQGDLPLRTVFPLLMTNALAWFQGQRGELRASLTTGSTYEVQLDQLAPAADSLVLRSPAGRTRPLIGSRVTIGPLDQCGVWSIEPGVSLNSGASVQTAPAPLMELAVNLGNAAESDLRTTAADATATPAQRSYLAGRPLWFYLTALATLLICIEWWLFQRRWIS